MATILCWAAHVRVVVTWEGALGTAKEEEMQLTGAAAIRKEGKLIVPDTELAPVESATGARGGERAVECLV